jgi:hypothetical protein
MRGGSSNRGQLRGIFVFALLAAFALLSLVIVIVGARSYRKIDATAERAYVSRTGLNYLAGKARGADETGMLSVRSENGSDVLVLGGLFDGERYNTYIYCDGAQVREYFAKADLAFSPDYGENIFPAKSMRLTLEKGLLAVELVDGSGETHRVSVFLQAAKEGGA